MSSVLMPNAKQQLFLKVTLVCKHEQTQMLVDDFSREDISVFFFLFLKGIKFKYTKYAFKGSGLTVKTRKCFTMVDFLLYCQKVF